MRKNTRGIPDRWLDYQPLGSIIRGTQIVAFKVPLKISLCQNHLPEKEEWFTPAMLLEKQPNLKTVIDLTNTFRYYSAEEEFGTKGVDHVKILVEGRGSIPPVSQLQEFFAAMDDHMEKYKDDTDALVGVHCTHGLNRTGYFVCRWMLERLNISAEDAIDRFNEARGYKIERDTLIEDLKNNKSPVPRLLPGEKSHSTDRPLREYRFPLEDERSRERDRNKRSDAYSRSRSSMNRDDDNSVFLDNVGSSRQNNYHSPLDDPCYDEPRGQSRSDRYRGRGRPKDFNTHRDRSVRIQHADSSCSNRKQSDHSSRRQRDRQHGRSDNDKNWRNKSE